MSRLPQSAMSHHLRLRLREVSLFFIAFFPQFIDPGGDETSQIFLLGATFFVIALTIDLIYAAASGSITELLVRRPNIARYQRRISALVYLLLARLAISSLRGLPI